MPTGMPCLNLKFDTLTFALTVTHLLIYSVVVVGNSHERPIFQGIFQWGRKLLWIATKAKLPETERRKSHEELVDLLTRMKECAIVSRGQRVSAVSLKLKCTMAEKALAT